VRDIIFGQNGADTITGGGGADLINGGAGNDTLVATVGDGNDAYDGGAGADDLYTLAATAAAATVDLALGTASSAETGSDTLVGVENVTGGTGNDVLRGDGANNTLIGGLGTDTLYAGLLGTDSLQGGQGDDTYIIDRTAGVTITEAAGAGVDTVLSLVTFTLGTNVENLTLTGTAAINGQWPQQRDHRQCGRQRTERRGGRRPLRGDRGRWQRQL
jgi:Ca2+-binding RTX toxin-like protein